MDNAIDFVIKRYTLPHNVFKNWVTMRKIIFSAVLLGAMASSAFADQTPAVASMAPAASAAPAPMAQSNTEFSVLQHPLYVGLITGYGNTNWQRLVSEDGTSLDATPSSADGQGALIGGLVGYDWTQYIGFEAQFIRFPNADVNFIADPLTPGLPNQYGGLTHMTSKTNYASMLVKASAPFDDNHFSGFGEIGYAAEMVSDVLANRHDFRPTFGFGVSWFALSHWTYTAAFNYTPGTGVASQTTAAGYIPYLYSGQIIIAYRI